MGAIIGVFLILLSPLFLCLFALGYVFSILWRIVTGKRTVTIEEVDMPYDKKMVLK